MVVSKKVNFLKKTKHFKGNSETTLKKSEMILTISTIVIKGRDLVNPITLVNHRASFVGLPK